MPTRAAVRDERNPAGYTLAGFFRVRAGMYTVQSGPGPPLPIHCPTPAPDPPGMGGAGGGRDY